MLHVFECFKLMSVFLESSKTKLPILYSLLISLITASPIFGLQDIGRGVAIGGGNGRMSCQEKRYKIVMIKKVEGSENCPPPFGKKEWICMYVCMYVCMYTALVTHQYVMQMGWKKLHLHES